MPNKRLPFSPCKPCLAPLGPLQARVSTPGKICCSVRDLDRQDALERIGIGSIFGDATEGGSEEVARFARIIVLCTKVRRRGPDPPTLRTPRDSRHAAAAAVPGGGAGSSVLAHAAAPEPGYRGLPALQPQAMPEVLESLAPHITPDHLVVSVAAGMTLATLEQALGESARVVRVMPNTPSLGEDQGVPGRGRLCVRCPAQSLPALSACLRAWRKNCHAVRVCPNPWLAAPSPPRAPPCSAKRRQRVLPGAQRHAARCRRGGDPVLQRRLLHTGPGEADGRGHRWVTQGAAGRSARSGALLPSPTSALHALPDAGPRCGVLRGKAGASDAPRRAPKRPCCCRHRS